MLVDLFLEKTEDIPWSQILYYTYTYDEDVEDPSDGMHEMIDKKNGRVSKTSWWKWCTFSPFDLVFFLTILPFTSRVPLHLL